jgi:hypothetical protein
MRFSDLSQGQGELDDSCRNAAIGSPSNSCLMLRFDFNLYAECR